MSRRNRLIWLTLLTTLVLALSSGLSEANDTYNFYFQKAPGPVNVHQGSASGPSPTPVVVQNPDGTASLLAPPAAAPTVVAASADLSEFRKANRWYLALGYNQIGRLGGDISLEDRTKGIPVLFGKSYSVSLEYDLLDRLSIFGDGYMTAKQHSEPKKLVKSDSGGSFVSVSRGAEHTPAKNYYSYAFGGAFSFIRTGSPKTASFSLAAIGGVTSIPYVQYRQTGVSGNQWVSSTHHEAGEVESMKSPFAGARARLLMFDTAGIDVAYRKILKAKEDSLRLSVAYAF